MNDDAELLRRYAVERSEADFAEVVSRHLDLVYSTALRLVGGDAHLAQDVTQTVFADLARKARSLSGCRVLSGWLYQATRFAAAKTVRTERRRTLREQEAVAMQEPSCDANWEQLRPVLDEAMGRLGAKDRDAILLRFAEGGGFAEGAVPDSVELRRDGEPITYVDCSDQTPNGPAARLEIRAGDRVHVRLSEKPEPVAAK